MAWFAVLAERYREAGIFQVTTPSKLDPIFVVNVDIAAELFDETRFEKVIDGPLLRIRRFAGNGLFTANNDDPMWLRAHHQLAPGFTRSSMERFFRRCARRRRIDKWRRAADDDRAVTADMTPADAGDDLALWLRPRLRLVHALIDDGARSAPRSLLAGPRPLHD